MQPFSIHIPGIEVPSNPLESTDRFQISQTFLISEIFRGDGQSLATVDVLDNQLFEYTFDDGTVWLGDPATMEEVFPDALNRMRGINARVLTLPTEISPGDGQRGGLNFKKLILKVFKVFVRKAIDTTLEPKIRELAEKLENSVLNEDRGVLKVSKDFGLQPASLTAGVRSLLFIHGTASSTHGSFDKLRFDRRGQESAVWNQIFEQYGGNVYAFEHKSLTESPLENVKALIEAIPDGAILELISQSRGGLVGDLLCRFVAAKASRRKAFSDTELAYLHKNDATADEELINGIQGLIGAKSITISKYIRVACPAAGSTLASKRLDIWLNVIFNLAGFATGPVGATVLQAFKELLRSVVETKDDPDILPGLAPQNPESAICKVINNPDSEVEIDIPTILIAGDNDFTLKWNGLINIVSNLFFLAQNDFIVNTKSMYKGPKRVKGKTLYFLDEGDEVSHFNYFKNETTQLALSNALATSGVGATGFAILPDELVQQTALRNIELNDGVLIPGPVSGKRPIVVLLPGIMGSNLDNDGHLLWVNYVRFAKGDLELLEYDKNNPKNIGARSVVGNAYTKIYRYLSTEYDVHIFPFDWRNDMTSNAALLDKDLNELLKHKQSIKLVGHSMGGVLVRDFMVYYPQTFAALSKLPDFRMIFLGSPLQGSFRIASVLYGEDVVIRQLALLDMHNSKKDLLEIFSKFPGILALLPNTVNAGNNFADSGTWQNMSNAFGDPGWPIPTEDVLGEFRNYRDHVTQRSASLDYSKAVYVAGMAEKGKGTVSGYEIVPKSWFFKQKVKLQFIETDRGDGSVTWDSGIPKRMRDGGQVYFSTVPHGELANDESLFLAISEILRTGKTQRLPQTELSPGLRSVEDTSSPKDRGLLMEDLDSSGGNPLNVILGLYGPDRKLNMSALPISVSITNADLRYAKSPILIGHFERDGIWSAELAIDKKLDGELSKRMALGLYPGRLGTSINVFPTDISGFPGAIITGLGPQGALNERVLQSAVESAVKQFLVSLIHEDLKDITASGQSASISSLLIGSGYGGLTLDRALRAILTGVQVANTSIRKSYPQDYVIINELEFIELFADQALAASRTLRIIETEEESRTLFIRPAKQRIREGAGRQRRVNMGHTQGWWSRVMARRYVDGDNVSETLKRGLLFTISTDAARVEQRSLFTASDDILDMVEEASEQNRWSPDLAKTLFEFLIPNDFKLLIQRQSNIIWQLDEYTAAFPWELLQDNIDGGKPISVTTGMVRQLTTQEYRIVTNPVTEPRALVIADPDLDNAFPQLPAAATEGGAVKDLLERNGFEVVAEIGKNAKSILRKLCVKPYKVLHVAGHGVFEYGNDKKTGVVLGPKSFLTADYISQMPDVPELVFVNCCYLGKIAVNAGLLATGPRNKLAANIGTQLIMNGAKAVVVTGWAVDDRAALLFAEVFYASMFRGDLFGAAVLKARRRVFDQFGHQNNTWGAYQCYGDASYKLESRASWSGGGFATDAETAEVVKMELCNILSDLEADDETASAISRLNLISGVLTKDMLEDASVLEMIAEIYDNANYLNEAIEAYSKLRTCVSSRYSMRALERGSYLRIKKSLLEITRQGGKPSAGQLNDLQTIITLLNSQKKFIATGGVHAALGYAFVHLAVFSNAKGNLVKAAKEYDDAYRADPTPTGSYYLVLREVVNYILERNAGVQEPPVDVAELRARSKKTSKRGRGKQDKFSCDRPADSCADDANLNHIFIQSKADQLQEI